MAVGIELGSSDFHVVANAGTGAAAILPRCLAA